MQHQLLTKANKFLRSLRIEFPKKTMEKEYRSLQEENKYKDFQVCLKFLIFLNIVGVIISAINQSWTDLTYAAAPVVLLVPVYCLRRHLAKYIQIVTLVIIIAYNTSRLFLLESYFENLTEGRLFYAGFSLATLESVLFVTLVKVSQKLFAIIVMIILRFAIVSAYIDTESFAASSFIRHLLIDSYLFYVLYSQEVNYRKIYQSFVNKKDELLKFKELLAESLPQSLGVFSERTNSLLFSNKTFQGTFSPLQSVESLYTMEDTTVKVNLETLIIDKSTVRDASSSPSALVFLDGSKDQLSVLEFLKKLNSTDYLNGRTISLSASTAQHETRKLFQITFKKVDWDSEDAVAVIFNDITYQECLIALKLANINKDKILATVSHELRTPLNGIIGILDMTEKEVDNPKITEYLSLCKDNAHLLLNLVNSILDFQQMSTGKLKLNPSSVDIRQVVNSIAQLFDFQCKEKNITLSYDVDPNVPQSIFTDQNRLKQVLINLVGNAIKFTSKGAVKIEVAMHQEEPDRLQISVKDTGIGIKKEEQKNLFQMYSKIESGESVNKNGVGLGLTISNALTTILNGGSEDQGIQVESEHGVGSRFYFGIQKELKERNRLQLPPFENNLDGRVSMCGVSTQNDNTCGMLIRKMSNEEERKAQEDYLNLEDRVITDVNDLTIPENLQLKLSIYETPKMSAFNLFTENNLQFRESSTKKKEPQESPIHSIVLQKHESPEDQMKCDFDVLIVDDNPFNLLVAKNLLKDFGCKTQTALGGPEAINIVKKNVSEGIAFKIIFMDCQMPIMDGFETTKALKAMMGSGEIQEAPIFAWTANNSEEDVKRCYEAGMVGHLSKPATKADLSRILSGIPGQQS